MTARLVLLLACISTCANTSYAQAPPAPDGIAQLLVRVQQALESRDEAALRLLIDASTPPEQFADFVNDLTSPDARRVVMLERDRVPLESAPRGDGYRLIVEGFVETVGKARIITSLVDVRRVTDGAEDSWRITGRQGLTRMEGLYRLEVNTARQLAARNLSITANDLRLTLHEGTVFLVEAEDGVTGLVLLGRGDMQFTPGPATEKGQLRIFSGGEALTAAFDTAFVRLNPSEYEQRVSTGSLAPVPVNARQLRRAQEFFTREAPKSFNLDLTELSLDQWYLLPTPGDFLAEVRTRRYGTLTYSRSSSQAEDVTVFDRERRRTIAAYPSTARAASNISFNEDERKDYDVLDYNVVATISPERQFIDSLVRMRLRVQASQLSSVTLRLADSLVVTGVVSADYGRLLPLRLRNQNTVIVSLPITLTRDAEITLLVAYSGRLESQQIDVEVLQVAESGQPSPLFQEEVPFMSAEPNFLLSNRSFWYPQNAVSDYATASMRITVPVGYTCVASGDLGPDNDVTLRDLLTSPGEGKAFVFRAADPLRYLALVVSRFERVGEATVTLPGTSTPSRSQVRVAVDANPRQRGPGRVLLANAQNIIRFYAGLMGDAPYGAATVALVENDLPGGHSPGYFAVVNQPLPYSPMVWRNDPAAFSSFPEFFVAHELAHQWWGQAVGWRNYHEQWLSEGFAQYFAALYARQARGETVFVDMLRQFRRWALAESDEGPISLGFRLGHIKGNSRVFRALIYNKSAAVLHMLRRTIGDEAFFSALRRFYTEQRFKKASTGDLRQVLEAESGRSLEMFFARWIYEADIPRIRYAAAIGGSAVTVRFEQVGGNVFELPVTVTLTYADGRSQDVIVQLDDRVIERRLPIEGVVKRLQVNRDFAALAYFEQR
ncbi:MAG: hypothetical protein EXQ59_03695 [Acidobacteria bacterium]|nr:hypothetical protein [Acidobacteriota bacterium]